MPWNETIFAAFTERHAGKLRALIAVLLVGLGVGVGRIVPEREAQAQLNVAELLSVSSGEKIGVMVDGTHVVLLGTVDPTPEAIAGRVKLAYEAQQLVHQWQREEGRR